MTNFRSALVSITFRKLSAEKIINATRSAGLEGIEWGGDVHVPHGDLKRASQIGKLTREAGLESFCYGSYYRFRDAFPDLTDTDPSIEEVLDTAEALGAPRIRLWAGESDYEEADADERQIVIEKAREIGELARKRGLIIDLEFHRGTLNNSADNSLQLLNAIGHPNIKTLWQPAVGMAVEDRLEGLRRLLPHVSNVHCFHWGKSGWKARQSLSDGVTEWQSYLRVLKNHAPPRWVALEFVKDDSLDQLALDSSALLRLLGN